MDLGGGGSNVTNVQVVTPDMEYSSGQVMAIAINSKFSCGYMWTREEPLPPQCATLFIIPYLPL